MNSFSQMQIFHKSFDVLQQEEKNTSGLLKPCICIGNKCDTAEIVRGMLCVVFIHICVQKSH